MSQRPLATMSEAAFDALIETYITRIAAGGDALPIEVFIALWFERRDVAPTAADVPATDRASAARTMRRDDTQRRSREDTNDGD